MQTLSAMLVLHKITAQKAKIFRCFALLFFCLTAPFLSMQNPLTQASYHADERLMTMGDWRIVKLWGRYSEGRAVFTSQAGNSFKVPFKTERMVSAVELRVYEYRGVAENTLSLHLADQEKTLIYGNSGNARTSVHTVTFTPPVLARTLEVRVQSIGKDTVLIDGVRIVDAGFSFNAARYGYHALIWGLLAASLMLAVRFAQASVVSSGQVYASVDMLRGIGALLVIALHATGYAGGLDLSNMPFANNIARQGHYGVEIFYVVSAFTLTLSLAASLRRGQTSHLVRRFWLRRILRIVPLFGTVFALCLGAGMLLPLPTNLMSPDLFFEVVWKYATMSYVFENDILKAPISHSVWWSISTEFQFYILMPLTIAPLLFWLLKYTADTALGWHLAIALGMAVLGTLLAASLREALSGQPWSVYTVAYHLDAFLIGIATALPFALAKPHQSKRISGSLLWSLITGLTLAVLLACVAVSSQVDTMLDLPNVFLGGRLSVIVICALTIVALRFAEDAGGLHVMRLRMLRTVGLLSFGIYVVHVPVMQLVGSLPVPTALGLFEDLYVWMFGLSLTGSLLLALLLHVLVEMPALAWARHSQKMQMLLSLSGLYVTLVVISFAYVLAEL